MATTKNIQSLERAFSILELFTSQENVELSLKEISDTLKLNKSTAFGLINTMYNLGYLKQNPNSKDYSLGLKFYPILNNLNINDIVKQSVHPYLKKLSLKYSETSHCAGRVNSQLIYIDKYEAYGSASLNTEIGSSNYLHCTGVGKCLLAYADDDILDDIISSDLREMTYNTITDPNKLKEELNRVRELGYAVDDEEISIGLKCIAVPILSSKNHASFSISVSGIVKRIDHAVDKGLVDDLKLISKNLSKLIYNYDS